MQLVVIHNPDAGGGGWTEARIEQLLRRAGHEARIVSKDGDWQNFLHATPDAFVAAGGDGTVHNLLRTLGRDDVPVAILPIGTANNVAHSLGYTAGEDLFARVQAWPARETVLQLGSVERNGQHRTFVEAVGIGAFADMVGRSHRRKKKSPSVAIALLAIRRKLVEMLLKAKPTRITTCIDGCTTTDRYLMLECVKFPYYGPRIMLAPAQTPEAATLTVWAVRPEARDTAAQYLGTGDGVASDFIVGCGSNVQLAVEDFAHVDGTPWPDKRAKTGLIEVRCAAARVRVWV